MTSFFRSVAQMLAIMVLSIAALPAMVAAQSTEWDKTWAEMRAAAQKEGQVVFAVNASGTQAFRQVLPELEKILGFKVQLLLGSASQLATQEVAARRAGKPIADLWINGPSSIVSFFVPAGAVQPLRPLLVHPEVIDGKQWFGDELPWASEWTLAFAADANLGIIVYNPKLVNPDDFTSFLDILNPKWKGKIVMRDPREDGVQSPRTFLYTKLGREFFTRLFDEMQPVIVPDPRTGVEWVARGKYSICIMGCNRAAEQAEAQGLAVRAAFPKILQEGFPVGMGGNGVTALKDPPHPAAQKYFINWFLSREGQEFYQKVNDDFSLRKDVPRQATSPLLKTAIEQSQHHWYDWKYPEPREESKNWMREMMKARGLN